MENHTSIFHPLDKESFAEEGEAIFRVIEDSLKPQQLGKIVAIEIESGDYFLGRTGSEAVAEAKKKYPSKIFYLARVGSKAAISFRSKEISNGRENLVYHRFFSPQRIKHYWAPDC